MDLLHMQQKNYFNHSRAYSNQQTGEPRLPHQGRRVCVIYVCVLGGLNMLFSPTPLSLAAVAPQMMAFFVYLTVMNGRRLCFS